MTLCGLYAITDEKLTPYAGGKIFSLVEKVLKGGARVVQLRDKSHPDEWLLPFALQLKELCLAYGAFFVVNDRVQLAQEVSALGLHLGREDEDLPRVRKSFPQALIGVSCYGDLEQAKRVEALGASYVAFGSFFPSPTKPEASLVPLSLIAEAKRVLRLPVCAIGGITLERAESLLALGADLLAVVSDLWTSEDPEKKARHYAELFKRYGRF